MAEGTERELGRLTRRQDFLAAARGRRFHTERMSVQGLAREEGALRVGLTVTKRVGDAPERNRIKRRLRAALLVSGAEHRDRPADVVVIARRDCLAAPFPLLVEDLGRALGKVIRPGSPKPPGEPRSPGEPKRAGPPRDPATN